MLDVRNLSASYPGGFALRDISFQICNPQMTGIIGPNGSGKSTLLKALCADLDSTGNIQLDGTDLRKARPLERARKVAVVPQSIEKIPVSVLEFVLAGRTPFKKWHQLTYSEADKVLAWEKLEEVGLLRNFDKKTLASKNMDELSGGERQLAAIAQALCQQPRLLLLDEPTANLDLCHQVEILRVLEQSLQKHGILMLMVIHDINLASAFCSRLLCLSHGSIVAEGETGKVIDKKLLESIYKTGLCILPHPRDGHPMVFPEI